MKVGTREFMGFNILLTSMGWLQITISISINDKKKQEKTLNLLYKLTFIINYFNVHSNLAIL